jgi:chromosome segregation ATPase
LRKLRSAASDGSLSIDDKTITIELVTGDKTSTETIPLTDTTELKEALERIIESKDIQIKSAKATNEFNEKRYADTEKQLRKTQKELDKITGTGVEGMPAEDYPVYKELADINQGITELFHRLNAITNKKEELSEANTQYMQGTIMYFAHMAGELSFNVPSYGEFYGDLNVTQADLDAAAFLPLAGVKNLPGHRVKG